MMSVLDIEFVTIKKTISRNKEFVRGKHKTKIEVFLSDIKKKKIRNLNIC